MKVGVIGCGNICGQYLEYARQFGGLEIAALADLDRERAAAMAERFGIARSGTVDELLGGDEVELVINLTIPAAHAEVALRAIEAGKHVYGEKPFTATVEQGQEVMAAGKRRGLALGCAPDTFLGTAHQTCRKLIDDGAIGRPVAATAFMIIAGHESWHPDPGFYYAPGGGPLLDMGPYYIHALVNLLGPVQRVSAEAGVQITPRTITSEPKRGQTIDVETPDHITASLQFEDGAIGTLVTSFAGQHSPHDAQNPITVYGTEGTLRVPDPNGFDGPVYLRHGPDGEDELIESAFAHPNGRSLGVAEMIEAIAAGRSPRASGALAWHALQVMHAALMSSEEGRRIEVPHEIERPAMMDADAVVSA